MAADFNQWLTKTTYEKVKERNGELSSEVMHNLKHEHLFTHQQQMASIIHNLDQDNTLVPGDGSSLLFEVYSKSGEEYIRTTLDGKPIKVNGAEGGISATDFWEYLYQKTYSGDEAMACSGQENPEAHTRPDYASWDDYTRARYGEGDNIEAIKPTKHFVSLPQVIEEEPEEVHQIEVTEYRPEKEVSYDTTTDEKVELHPIHMQEIYVPQEQIKDQTYVHETYLPQLEKTFIHNTRLAQINGEEMTTETLISIP